MYKSTWAVLVLVLLLAVVAYVVHQWEPLTPERALHPLDFDALNVVGIRILNRWGEVFCKKNGNEWLIVEPEEYPADTIKVARVIANLETVETDRPLPKGRNSREELEKAGLVSSAARFVILAKDREIRGVIGKPSLVGTRTLMAVEGRRGIFSIVSTIAEVFHEAPESFRDPRALRFEWAELTGIQVTSGDLDVVLKEKTAGHWTIAEPFAGPANPVAMARILRLLQDLRVLQWMSAQDRDYLEHGLETVQKRISAFWGEEGEQREDMLFLGNAKDSKTVFGRRKGAPQVFTVDRNIVEQLFSTMEMDQLRDSAILRSRGFQIQEVVIERKTQTCVSLRKTNESWEVQQVSGKADCTEEDLVRKVEAILEEFEKDRIDCILTLDKDVGKYGFSPDCLTIKVRFRGPRGLETIQVAGRGEKKMFMRRRGGSSILVVSEGVFRPLLSSFFEMGR